MSHVASTSLRNSLEAIVGSERVLDRPIDLIAFAADAGFYRLIPKAVVFAASVEDIQGLFRLSHEQKIPMTFRAAGTSLSGQPISAGLLAGARRLCGSIRV